MREMNERKVQVCYGVRSQCEAEREAFDVLLCHHKFRLIANTLNTLNTLKHVNDNSVNT